MAEISRRESTRIGSRRYNRNVAVPVGEAIKHYYSGKVNLIVEESRPVDVYRALDVSGEVDVLSLLWSQIYFNFSWVIGAIMPIIFDRPAAVAAAAIVVDVPAGGRPLVGWNDFPAAQ